MRRIGYLLFFCLVYFGYYDTVNYRLLVELELALSVRPYIDHKTKMTFKLNFSKEYPSKVLLHLKVAVQHG